MSDLISRAETHEIRTETHGVCLISKDDAIETVCRTRCRDKAKGCPAHSCPVIEEFDALPSADAIDFDFSKYQPRVRNKVNDGTPSADAVQGWIPCSDRLPRDDEIVNITWVNHNPPPYYADIAEKPFVASGLRYRDKWYWYSSVCQDLHQDFDLIDKDIEVIAWMPLPKPYREESEVEE